MEKCEILFSRGFKKDLSEMPADIQTLAEEKMTIFTDNPFDPRLKTHKLHGKDGDKRAFSVNHYYRIKFTFLSGRRVIFIAIGTHSIYQ
jgi:mRNA-degrading endonuclease RelE of RelBE toxin-antitoxin system